MTKQHHTAQILFKELGREVFQLLTCNPVKACKDFHVFDNLKTRSRGWWFANDDQLNVVSLLWLYNMKGFISMLRV